MVELYHAASSDSAVKSLEVRDHRLGHPDIEELMSPWDSGVR